MQMQPDNRIGVWDLGYYIINGRRYVVNRRPGVPRNAVIEEVDGNLRCWASRIWLTDEAAQFVRQFATHEPNNNSFIWNQGVRVEEVRKGY